jgi:IclR family pca regulon transcriptional regulator
MLEANDAIVGEEVEPGMRTMAVPLRNTHGEVAAAVNPVMRARRMAVEDMLAQFLPILAKARDALRRPA